MHWGGGEESGQRDSGRSKIGLKAKRKKAMKKSRITSHDQLRWKLGLGYLVVGVERSATASCTTAVCLTVVSGCALKGSIL